MTPLAQSLTKEERRTLAALDTPWKIQDFLETIPINMEPEGDTCLSPRRVLRERRAHCIEAAMVAALALRLQGEPPLLVDMAATDEDFDHVIAVYRRRGLWGAISKSNHAVLRYRDPIYRTIRELIASYFHEYTDDRGAKTLRSFTRPFNLARLDRQNWMTSEESVWCVPEGLIEADHERIFPNDVHHILRRADPIEQQAGKLLQWS